MLQNKGQQAGRQGKKEGLWPPDPGAPCPSENPQPCDSSSSARARPQGGGGHLEQINKRPVGGRTGGSECQRKRSSRKGKGLISGPSTKIPAQSSVQAGDREEDTGMFLRGRLGPLTGVVRLSIILLPGAALRPVLPHSDLSRLSLSAHASWLPLGTIWQCAHLASLGDWVAGKDRGTVTRHFNPADPNQGWEVFLSHKQENPSLANLSRKGIC